MRLLYILLLTAFSLSFSLTAFSQTFYNGLVRYEGQVIDCSHVLNRYAHSGVPSIKEDKLVKKCCAAVREIAKNEGVNELLVAHMRTCRQLGR